MYPKILFIINFANFLATTHHFFKTVWGSSQDDDNLLVSSFFLTCIASESCIYVRLDEVSGAGFVHFSCSPTGCEALGPGRRRARAQYIRVARYNSYRYATRKWVLMKFRSCLVCICTEWLKITDEASTSWVFITKHQSAVWFFRRTLTFEGTTCMTSTSSSGIDTFARVRANSTSKTWRQLSPNSEVRTSPWSWAEIKAELSPKDLKRLFLEPSHIQERYVKVLALSRPI